MMTSWLQKRPFQNIKDISIMECLHLDIGIWTGALGPFATDYVYYVNEGCLVCFQSVRGVSRTRI